MWVSRLTTEKFSEPTAPHKFSSLLFSVEVVAVEEEGAEEVVPVAAVAVAAAEEVVAAVVRFHLCRDEP